jgi:hypothetical protein
VDAFLTEAISNDFSQDAHGERNHVERSVPPDLVDMAQERDAEESDTYDRQRVARTVGVEHKVAVSHGVQARQNPLWGGKVVLVRAPSSVPDTRMVAVLSPPARHDASY